MSAKWFSAKLRYAVLIESKGLDGYMDSVFLFQGSEFEDAFQRAVAIGRKREQEYFNGDRQRVRWRLASIVSLDILPDFLDGAEIYSEPVPAAGERIAFDYEFHPERSSPTQTI
jgi:hypothetical protein